MGKLKKQRRTQRHDLIQQKRKSKNKKDDKIRMIFTHNSANPPLNMWLREAKKCLVKNEKAKQMGENMQICFSQPKNLKRIASQKSKPKSVEPEPWCWKCGHCRVSCPILKEGTHFTSNNTKRTYPIRQKLNCDSSYVIYLGTCKKCRGQYVGKSQTPFKKRHSNHKQEVRKSIGGLGHHYGGDGCGYESISIQIIEGVEQGDQKALCHREIFWQNQLRCYVQNGGNTHCYRKEKKK
jgi:hypothetical protein